MGLFDFFKKEKKTEEGVKEGLEKTSSKLGEGLATIFLGKKEIDAESLEELEEILITSDLGVAATDLILENVRSSYKRGVLKDKSTLVQAIKQEIVEILKPQEPSDEEIENNKPYVILVSGVNGVGKTTSIAKLANMYKNMGKKVMVAAGDTFRAAAADQLTEWANRLDIPIVKQGDGSDPAAVVHDGVNSAIAKGMDILIADTAGRLHTKHNLMQELIKIERVVSKLIPNAPHEKLLVLDATSGQNAISQAKAFKEAIGINALVLTKLDGTAKGGVLVSIVHELGLPVKYIGFGEGVDDLRPFDAELFADALFQSSENQ